MTLNTTYASRLLPSFIGSLIDTSERKLLSRVAEVDGITAGMPLMKGTLADDNVLPYDGSDEFVGVCVRTHSINDAEWKQGEHIRMLEGHNGIWCEPPVAVANGDPVHVLPTGEYSNTGGVEINARWESTTAAGELGKWRFKNLIA